MASQPQLPPSANSGAAYERKKQRAKDARVKLNESIERLAIAINLAGSQSKQRKVHAKDLENRTVDAMKDCVDTAESAKKWDRPSFVGAAATLIQGLNTQCEALMRELVKAQKQNERVAMGNETTVSIVSNCDSESGSNNHNNNSNQNSSGSGVDDDSSSNKRRKVAVVTGDPIAFAFSCRKTLTTIASFLDPQSLLRCNKLSRSIKETRIFDGNPAWLNLAIQRYGPSLVRQWQERLEDQDEEVEAQQQQQQQQQQSAARGIGPMEHKKRPINSTMALTVYRQMDGANERPHLMDDGAVFLGEARLPQKISCWVTMIERSNGETIRSVRRRPQGLGTNRMGGVGGSTSSGGTASRTGGYSSLPVLELRFLIQNTGSNHPIGIKEQLVTVDASTRRRGDEWTEITWDDRFAKHFCSERMERVKEPRASHSDLVLHKLRLYEWTVMVVYIHAKGCSTSSKFRQRANFTKVLVSVNGTTIPLVVPFVRDNYFHMTT